MCVIAKINMVYLMASFMPCLMNIVPLTIKNEQKWGLLGGSMG